MFSTPRRAATVMILRESSEHSLEVLMLLRHPDNKFVPLNYVYPGGAVDTDDTAPELIEQCRGIRPRDALNVIPHAESPDAAIGYWIAAVRETFEETGILYAVRHDGEPFRITNEREKERFFQHRQKIFKKELLFHEMLQQEDLFPDAGRLFFFSRWITPPFSAIRYDAHFFVAGFPEGQEVSHDGTELTDHCWIRPADALEKYRHREFRMVLPTVETLREVSVYNAIDDAITGLTQSSYRHIYRSG
jgi:8-oxo-dGTP pyrophosphatase MutT (NUDIX family)